MVWKASSPLCLSAVTKINLGPVGVAATALTVLKGVQEVRKALPEGPVKDILAITDPNEWVNLVVKNIVPVAKGDEK